MSKKTSNKPKRTQFLFFLLMFLSGGSIFYIKTLPDKQQNIWLLLTLLIVLLYSFMKSTKNWAYDNPKETEEENEENKIVYKNTDIPSLEEMIKNSQKKED